MATRQSTALANEQSRFARQGAQTPVWCSVRLGCPWLDGGRHFVSLAFPLAAPRSLGGRFLGTRELGPTPN